MVLIGCFIVCLQCFTTVGWASGRASGLQKLSDEVLVWLSVWSDVQIVCVWSSWCPASQNPRQVSTVPFLSLINECMHTSSCTGMLSSHHLHCFCLAVFHVNFDKSIPHWFSSLIVNRTCGDEWFLSVTQPQLKNKLCPHCRSAP